MRYPCLVRKNVCTTPAHLEIKREGLTKYGEPLSNISIDCMCNYQDNAKTIYTDDKKLVELVGCAYFQGDIVPELPTISGGTITINGETRGIHIGTKARNPDSTVNFTKIEVK